MCVNRLKRLKRLICRFQMSKTFYVPLSILVITVLFLNIYYVQHLIQTILDNRETCFDTGIKYAHEAIEATDVLTVNIENDYDLNNQNTKNLLENFQSSINAYKNRSNVYTIGIKDVDIDLLIDKYLRSNNRLVNDAEQKKLVSGILKDFSTNVLGKEIQKEAVNEKRKLNIRFRDTTIYRIDLNCFWISALDEMKPYISHYNYTKSRFFGNKIVNCPKYKQEIDKSSVPYNHDDAKRYLKYLINQLKVQDVTIYNDKYLKELQVNYPIKGGSWFPSFDYEKYYKMKLTNESYDTVFSISSTPCIPNERVAIIIAMKNREDNLNIFLPYMHYYLQKQKKSYKIFVIEQINDIKDVLFNKGRLYNAGYKYAIKDLEWEFNCVILHDVDLLPINLYLDYSCGDMPKHLSINIKRLKDNTTSPHYKFLTGGVLAIRPHHYEHLNGYSNEYFGWGGEDDDFTIRIIEKELCVLRPEKNVANYVMLQHGSSKEDRKRWELIMSATERVDTDGLSNINNVIKITSVIKYPKYTHVKVDVDYKH